MSHVTSHLPNGRLQKRPQACFTQRTLQHLCEIFFHRSGTQPRRVGNKQIKHDMLEVSLKHGCGIAL